jgi:protein-L-isoaspartate O-methyltransferase
MNLTRRAAILSAFPYLGFAAGQDAERYPDVPYVPTPIEVVEQMLKLADVRQGDVVYDLGSGDGRVVIMAAEKFGARATGVEVNPELIRDARRNAQQAGVSDRVNFVQGDLFQSDLRPATVVTLYLLPALNQKLRPKLFSELKPGTRVVSFSFDMGDWKPQRVADINGRRVYLWIIGQKSK